MTDVVILRDGRELAYDQYGDPAGFPVLSCHGGMSSRLDAAPADGAALAKGVRLISPDRPGMGLSTYQPGRRLLDWPEDVRELTESLGIERFAVMGWSAGGPYAAACAARLGDRVTAAALLSSSVPLDAYGTSRGLTPEDRGLPVPEPPRALAGLHHHEGQHHQHQQHPAPTRRHALVSAGRSQCHFRVGTA